MSVSTVTEPPVTTNRRTFPGTDPRDPDVRLPLRAELFLVAHDDDTGRPHLNRQALCQGLAAAILLELWLSGRILIGKAFRVRDGYYTPDQGRITIIDPTPLGDPLTDAAMNLLHRASSPIYVKDFIRTFATPDLYDRALGDMLLTGILRRTSRRRWFGLFRYDTYRTNTPTHQVRTRAWLRNLAQPRHPNHELPQTIALAGLVTALALTENLHHPDPAALHARLTNALYRSYDSTIRDVTNTLNPHGHLARRTG